MNLVRLEQPGAAGDRIRAFIALRLPGDWVELLARLLSRLKARPAGRPVRWVRADQLHLTLKFLGNLAPADVPRLSARLAQACRDATSFELALGELGAFPDLRRPRVVWIGLRGALDPLASLQRQVERAAEGFGDHREEREFQPHLTLGRVAGRGSDVQPLGAVWDQLRPPVPGPWRTREVSLFRSELCPEGAKHTELARFDLRD